MGSTDAASAYAAKTGSSGMRTKRFEPPEDQCLLSREGGYPLPGREGISASASVVVCRAVPMRARVGRGRQIDADHWAVTDADHGPVSMPTIGQYRILSNCWLYLALSVPWYADKLAS